jgi:hypothetical protein
MSQAMQVQGWEGRVLRRGVLVTLLALTAATLAAATAQPAVADEDEPLPVVEETYEAVWMVHERSESRSWEVSRLYFIRQGRVIADRIVCDDMLWSAAEGKFILCWNDYGNCQRVVRTSTLKEMSVDLDDLDARSTDSAPWWGMGRRMTDLEAPR